MSHSYEWTVLDQILVLLSQRTCSGEHEVSSCLGQPITWHMAAGGEPAGRGGESRRHPLRPQAGGH
jgi:hypothetical protein